MGLFSWLLGESHPPRESHPFYGWEEIEFEKVPRWAQNRLGRWILQTEYITVNGRHFRYRKWHEPPAERMHGRDGEDRYFRKKL